MSAPRRDRTDRMAALASSRQKPATETPKATPRAPRAKPVRITVDLDPGLYRDLRQWALDHESPRLADIVRALIGRLRDDEQLSEEVAAEVRPDCNTAYRVAVIP